MKNTFFTPSAVPTKTIKPDPFKRLSIAVKNLDQLINRAHQLGSFTNQLLREDKTGPDFPYSKTNPPQPVPSNSLKKLNASRKAEKKNKEEL